MRALSAVYLRTGELASLLRQLKHVGVLQEGFLQPYWIWLTYLLGNYEHVSGIVHGDRGTAG